MRSSRDARTDAVPTRLSGTVAIIGAGAAGITLARALAATVGDVLLIESGGLAFDPATQDLYAGDLLGLPYYPLDVCRLRYFGGTTNHWAGYCRSNDPVNFEARPDLGLPAWPVAFDTLAPYVAGAARLLGIRDDFFAPADIIAAAGVDTGTLFDAESPDFFVSANQIAEDIRFAERFGDEIGRSGRITLVTHLNACEVVLTADGGAVDHVLCRTLTGKTVAVSARHVVLACHTIETARILLNSNRQQPRGVGNGHDQVGRYFSEHPYVLASLIVASETLPAVLERQVGEQDRLLVGLSLTPEAMRREGVLAYNCFLNSHFFDTPLQVALRSLKENATWPFTDDVLDAIRTLVGDPGFMAGAVAREVGLDSAPRFLVLESMIEQAPNPHSRVVLSPDRRDALGLPAADLDWRLSELDMRTLQRGQDLVVREFGSRGWGRVRVEPMTEALVRERVVGHYHHYGTTRMATTPSAGVVDADLRVFGVGNLSICSTSVFPTGGAHGPTMHLIALANRLADRLRAEFG